MFLDCFVSNGMFSTERGISLVLPDGANVVAFVDQSDVILPSKYSMLSAGQKVRGQVLVSVIGRTQEGVLVDLPQPSIAQGTRIIVNQDQLKEAVA
jgi:hypothetical protein